MLGGGLNAQGAQHKFQKREILPLLSLLMKSFPAVYPLIAINSSLNFVTEIRLHLPQRKLRLHNSAILKFSINIS